MNNKIPQKILKPLTAAAITGVIATTAFYLSGRFPGKDHIFMTGDFYSQYLHFIKLFFRSLLSGSSLEYSFEFSMGMPTWPAYAYECMSPVNLIFLLISDPDTAAYIVVLIKLMLAAASFCIFMSIIPRAKPITGICFSCAYALCGYCMSFYYNVQFMDAVYILPVLVLCIFHFVRSKRKTGLILSYTFCFITLFYSGYMIGIFSIFVFFSLMLYEYRKDITKYIHASLGFILIVLCSILLSGIVTFPAAIFLSTHMPHDSSSFSGLSAGILDILIHLLPGQAVPINGNTPALYSSFPAVVLVPIFFFSRHIDKRLKLLAGIPLVFLIICTLFGPAYMLIHGFDAPDMSPYRFSYMFSFIMITLAVYVLSSEKITIIKKYENLICIFLLIELLISSFLHLIPDSNDLSRIKAYYDYWLRQGNAAMAELPDTNTSEEFYRVHYENPSSENNSLFWGYNGIGYFSTLEHPNLRQALFRLGYSTSTRTVADLGSTELSRMLFSQRYTIHATNPRIQNESEFSIEKNNLTLPLIYMTSDSLTNYHADELNAFNNLNGLASAMIGTDIDIFSENPESPDIIADNLILQHNTDGWNISSPDHNGGNIVITLNKDKSRKLYAYFSQVSSSKIFKSAKIASNSDVGLPLSTSYLSMPHIIPVTEDSEGISRIFLLISPDDIPEASFCEMNYAYLNDEKLRYLYELLSNSGLEDYTVSKAEINADIDVSESFPLLFTSIPYEKGWHAELDGAEIPTISVLDDAFLAVPLYPGFHHIRLYYIDRSITIGSLMSFIGIILFFALIFIPYIRNKRKQ